MREESSFYVFDIKGIEKMRAVAYTEYGLPEVAKLAEVSKPEPKVNELLIKVHASTVNRTDPGFRSAEYFVSRFWSGLLRPKYQIFGCEFAGVIEAIGKGVTTFKVGDRIFGFNDKSFGGHAEYSPSQRSLPFRGLRVKQNKKRC